MERRTVLRGAVVGATAVAVGDTGGAAAAPQARVVVLGGGVAGLTAAHELAERGFAVTVYERRALGGKSRSVPVVGTSTAGRKDLPGEHGFRFFPGFYHHVPDTLRRIPFPGRENGVWGNLVTAPVVRLARCDKSDLLVPVSLSQLPQLSVDTLRETMTSLFTNGLKLPVPESLHFAERLIVYFTSCDSRRFGQWEHVSWRRFLNADRWSAEYTKLISHGFSSSLVAAKENLASSRTIGAMAEQFFGNPGGVGNDGPLDRVLDGPTTMRWITPWVYRLHQLGVRFVLPATVESLVVRDRRIAAARITDAAGRTREVTADYFVVALPVGPARKLWSRDILALYPELAGMHQLRQEWMNGIQFFLRRPTELSRGHISFIDSPWALTGVTQGQFWQPNSFAGYGDGQVRDCLSVDISDWDTPGIRYRKPARECTHDEIPREVWAQIKAHLGEMLQDSDLHSWALDPGITWDPSRRRNDNADPLLVNTVGSWQYRPNVHGSIENMFLAADYVRTSIDLATMEGACEAARKAVNALLDVSGSTAPRCRVFQLHQAAALEPLRRMDADRYARGLPNLFDVP